MINSIFHEKSFGIIPLKKEEDQWQTFLVKIKSGNHWGFPKGHADNLELPIEVAKRELKEETNLSVVGFLSEEPLIEEYQFYRDTNEISKKVYYFLAEVEGLVQIQVPEVLEGKWVNLKEAKEIITFETSKKIASLVEIFLENI